MNPLSLPHKAVLVGLALFATFATVPPALAERPSVGVSAAHSTAIRRFWTPTRMASARLVPGFRRGSRAGSAHSGAPAQISSAPETIVDPAAPGYSQYGAVFGINSEGERFRCSGTSVAAPNRSLVITAGHCVHDEGRWSSRKFVFVPGYRYGERPLGVFVAHWLGTTKPWLEHEDSNFDVGMAVVGRNERHQTLAAAAGADGFASGLPANQTFDIYGYPVAHPFTGATLQRCPQTPFEGHDFDSFFWQGPLDLAVQCNFTGGSSGGAWVIAGNRIDGVTSYGYGDDPSTNYGPYFGAGIARLYREASSVK